MLVTQEPIGKILVPLALSTGNNVYTLLNELGIVLIPFSYIMVKSAIDAKTKNSVSSNAAIMAFKEVELKFYSMLIIVTLFMMPMYGNQTTTYSAYKCSSGNRTTLANDSLQLPDSVNSSLENATQIPLGWAWVNHLTNGFSGALTGKISCSETLSYDASELTKSMQMFDDKNLIYSAKEFDQQCYSEGERRISESVYDDTTILTNPYDNESNYFFGTNFLSAYSGTHKSPNMGGVTFVLEKDEWAGSGISFKSLLTDTKETMSCSAAALELYDAIEDKIDEDTIKLIAGTDSLYSNASESSVTQKLIHYAFIDMKVNKEAVVSPDTDKSIVEMISTSAQMIKKSAENIADTFANIADIFANIRSYISNNKMSDIAGDLAMGVMHFGGSVVGRFNKNLETVSIHAYLPVFVILGISMVYVAAPFMIVLAGYSWNMIWGIMMLMGYFSMCFYILELSYVFENVVVLAIQSDFGSLSVGSNYQVVKLIANSLSIISLVLWSMICGLLGLNIVPALGVLFSGASVKAGQNASKVASQLAQVAVKAVAA